MNEKKNENAWMINNTGTSFPVLFHIYGNEEDFLSGNKCSLFGLNATCEASIWLFDHTQYSFVKQTCMSFLSSWIIDICKIIRKKISVETFLLIDNQTLYLNRQCRDFIRRHANEFSKMNFPDGASFQYAELVCCYLNQEFMRARIGGLYNSEPGNRHLYCRISSAGFDWLPIIYKLAEETNPSHITICRDHESTGVDGFLKYKEILFENLTLSEFLKLKESNQTENSRENMFTKMNNQRIIHRCFLYRLRENRRYVPRKEGDLIK